MPDPTLWKVWGIVYLYITILEECILLGGRVGGNFKRSILRCMLWSHNAMAGEEEQDVGQRVPSFALCWRHFSILPIARWDILPVVVVAVEDTKKLGSRIAHGGDEEAA